jgi:hypothetical protein
MNPSFYIAVGIVVIPVLILSIRRGLLLGRIFKAMAADLEGNQIKWEVAKLRSALMQWTRNPAKVVEMCEEPRSREIVSRHAGLAVVQSGRLKTITTVWTIAGIAGAILWLFFTEPERSNPVSKPTAASDPGSP